MTRGRTRVPAIALLAATVGCSVSAGGVSVNGNKLEKVVSDRLTATVGQRPDNVSCPHALDGTKGATTRCTLTAGHTKYGVTVTTTSVQGGHVKFAIKVDNKPMH
ncbi:MAG: DUF4333 domain-containing protein [Nocardioidaceae bacterium]